MLCQNFDFQIDKEINLARLVGPDSRLQFILTDYSRDGDCYLYISDAGTSTIIVYDVGADKGYKVAIPPAAVPKDHDVLYITLVRRPSSERTLYTSHTVHQMTYFI